MTDAAGPACSLLLLRHGIAEERGGLRPDPERSLTEAGRRRTRKVCRRLRRLGLVCDSLLASPLLRAHQTAEIAVREGLAPELRPCDALRPGSDPWPLLLALITALRPGSPMRIGLVGHEPDLSGLAARLLGAPPGAIDLRKAGVILLALTPLPGGASPAGPAGVESCARASLQALVPPRILLP
ncbi:phosphohistidine phosphatase SixA [Synechococcus sp. RSCCF101]|uniref:phosphohistidine phosphatase SixA n=1 Tax=Synechococcus sp. RSCCF101 TaxID=2511069 RepID=UPI00124832E3|nr:phosphohistidine phosphatase SixA [Synechococcus sp. RSCCF101]QEY32867.1 phosphohistidine phosphatase SixA [Synechococcus sp. RSCCF101]